MSLSSRFMYLVWPLLLLLGGVSSAYASDSSVLEKGQQCRKISDRLQRLHCFDRLFATPINITQGTSQVSHSLAWKRAVESEKNSQHLEFHLSMLDSANLKAGIWLTASALEWPGRDSDTAMKPILMLSCDNSISRVQLILPQPIDAGRVRITVDGHGQNTQSWLTDDSGMVLESARGLPAIHLMRKMIKGSQIALRSDSALVDGLIFSTTGLATSIKSLRKTCRW
ncbi:type VI secretion system-associated protein VasI [Celerinatantimonas yamalensis]|uniref:Type VI secretion system-associated protein VasI n=1 Tax=Celerinatantimonas yamalensis TaxID=559956 RepID=A0ABW9G5W1_9GAMM